MQIEIVLCAVFKGTGAISPLISIINRYARKKNLNEWAVGYKKLNYWDWCSQSKCGRQEVIEARE